MVKFPVKSGWCPRRFCRGGVLLTEFETSPLQVIWTLRLGAALWSSSSVFWEPEPAQNHQFWDFHDFYIFHKNLSFGWRTSRTIAKTLDLDQSIRNDLLYRGIQRFRLVIRSDFEKNLKIVVKTLILSGPPPSADQPASVLLTEDNSSSASYLNIARLRSALELRNGRPQPDSLENHQF